MNLTRCLYYLRKACDMALVTDISPHKIMSQSGMLLQMYLRWGDLNNRTIISHGSASGILRPGFEHA